MSSLHVLHQEQPLFLGGSESLCYSCHSKPFEDQGRVDPPEDSWLIIMEYVDIPVILCEMQILKPRRQKWGKSQRYMEKGVQGGGS